MLADHILLRDYVAKVFGSATFGTVYGAIICLSGLFTFTQSGLQALLHHTFKDDPEPINLGLATVGLVIGVAMVMYVDVKGRALRRERIKTLNEERRNMLFPRLARAVTPIDDPERRPLLNRALSTVQETREI